MSPKKEKLLNDTYHKWMQTGLYDLPLDGINEFVDPEIMGYGTAIDEKVLSITEYLELINTQREQAVGLEISIEITPVFRSISNKEDSAIFVDEIKVSIIVNEDKQGLFLRITTILEYIDSKWIVVHWHGSIPTETRAETDTWLVNEWKRKNEELQKLVDEKTSELLNKNKELEIEAALEKVRSSALTMKQPSDMLDVCKVISDQLQLLGVNNIRNVQTAIINEQKGAYLNYQYFIAYDKGIVEDTEYNKHPKVFEMVQEMKRSENSNFSGSFEGEELNRFREYRKQDNQFPDPLLDAAKSVHYYFYSIGSGGLGLSTYEPLNDDALEIFKRFHNVFTLAYRRFIDIEKAEAQAKEAQIELALERVRARTMAMQSSNELKEVVLNMFDGLKSLGVDTTVCNISLIDYKTYDSDLWSAHQTDSGLITYRVFISHFEHPFRKKLIDSFLNKISFSVHELSGDLKKSYIQYLIDHVDYSKVPAEVTKSNKKLINIEEGIVLSAAYMKYGLLIVSHSHAISNDESDILQRFAKIFEQTYTRFLDLKKAETQARESQIELALERVRARTMAMQQSDELSETARVLFQQFKELGEDPDQLSIGIVNESEKVIEIWLSVQGNIMNKMFKAPIDEPTVINKIYTSWKEKRKSVIIDISGDELERYNWYRNSNVEFKEYNEVKNRTGKEEHRRIIYTALFSKGLLSVATQEPRTEETIKLLERFASVFDGTYTRFLDLQKAEDQAREAEIELGLERVRATTMSMKIQDDLLRVIESFGDQLVSLGFRIDVASFINGVTKTDWDLWLYSPNFEYPPRRTLVPYKEIAYFIKTIKNIEKYEKSGDEIQDKSFTKAEKDEFLDHYFKENPADEDLKTLLFATPGSTIIDAFLGNVTVSIVKYELEPYSEEEHEIFKRFSYAFKQAYTRFLDLQKAEAQAKEAKIETSMEKIRSRSLAMQKPEELVEVAELLRKEMGHLGVEELETSSIYIVDNENQQAECWYAIKDIREENKKLVSDEMTLMLSDTWVGNEMWMFYRSKKEQISIVMKGDNRKEWINYCANKSKVLQGYYGNEIPERTYHLVKFNGGYMGAASPGDISSESWDLLKRAAAVFSLAYTRFKDLQDAETRAREAQIELSLERIRAQVTAMRESSELLDIVVTMRSEFVALGHEAHYFWHMRWLPDKYEKAMTSGDGTRIGMVMTLPRHIHGDVELVADWEKSDEPTLVFAMDVNTAVEYVEKMITLGDFQQVDPQAPTLEDIRHIGGLTFIMARTTHGEIGFSLPGTVPNPPEESVTTLARFAGVFDLAYKRFEDLKSTERQHREAQIELALERTRTQSMLMKHSSELNEISKTFHEQLLSLGIDSEFSFVWLPDEDKQEHMFWATWVNEINGVTQYQSKEIKYALDKTEPGTAKCYRDWESGQSVHETYVPPDQIVSFFAAWEELLRGADQFKPELFPEGIYYTEAYMKYGCFGIDIRRQLTSEEKEIIRRFSVEFERTYTRFLDLQKAEAQAREAKIEAALEKVRSKTMAMQSSDELADTAAVVFQQLIHLGIEPNRIYITIIKDESGTCEFWITDGDGSKVSSAFRTNLNENNSFKKMYSGWIQKTKSITINMQGEELQEYFKHLSSLNVPFKGGLTQKRRLQYIAYFSKGFIGVASPDETKLETIQLLERFAAVFNLTYTRFNDLKQAEAQNKIIQTENDRKTKELEDARQLQLSMLPKKLPKLPHLDIAVYMKTATEVGGDYYDFNVDVNGTLTFIVGDATGHGMMSGMMVSIMKSFFISHRTSLELKEFFEKTNNSLKEMQLGRMMMPLIGVQINSEKIIATNAGMPSLLYFRNKSQKAGEFVSNNLPLGGMKGTKYLLKAVRYEKGDTLLLMSDGFAELKNLQNQQYGYTRIKEKFRSLVHKSSNEIIE